MITFQNSFLGTLSSKLAIMRSLKYLTIHVPNASLYYFRTFTFGI